MSALTRFALDTSRLTIVAIVTIVLLGLHLFFTFPRQEDPPIVIREIVVTALFPGMEPQDMEELITRKLEAQMRTLPEIKDIWSDSKTGIVILHAVTRDEYNDLDNGVVVAENIGSRLQQGEEKYHACLAAGRTLAIPLLTSSLTSILAFTPMLLLNGSTGEYVFSLPMVVTILLLSSWFLSMYMTPAMSFWFMKVAANAPAAAGDRQGHDTGTAGEPSDPYTGRFYQTYRRLLGRVLHHRFQVLVLAGAAFVGGGVLASLLVREFFGPSDRNQFLVYVDLPAGYSIKATDDVVKRLTAWLADKRQNPEITSSIAYIGTGGPHFFLSLSPLDPDPHRAFLVVNTQTGERTPQVVARVRQYVVDALPEVQARVKQMWLGATEPGLVEIRLIGPDPGYLHQKGDQLAAGLNTDSR